MIETPFQLKAAVQSLILAAVQLVSQKIKTTRQHRCHFLQSLIWLHEQFSTVIQVLQTAVKGIEGKCGAVWRILP